MYDNTMPMQEQDRERRGNQNNMEMRGMSDMNMNGMYTQTMGMQSGMKRNKEENEKVAEQVYSIINEHMCKAIAFHEQLADYFCFLNLQGFKRMLDYQYMKECADKRKLHKRYINYHHKLIPVKQIQIPVFIPTEWNKYKTTDINDSVVPKFVRSALEQYKDWEEKTKEMYEEQCDVLRKYNMVSDEEYLKELIISVEKELKKIHRMIEKMNGTGYDVTTIHNMQDKYHEKYKKKYDNRFTTKNNYRNGRYYNEMEEWEEDGGKRIGFI